MRIVIDTNVVIDIFQRREPFFTDSYRALNLATNDENSECLFSVTAVTDVFYLLRKVFKSADKAKHKIEVLSQLVTFAEVQAIDIFNALLQPMSDFEDSVVNAVAERYEADYILTRNTKDFSTSVIPAITPTELLKIFDAD